MLLCTKSWGHKVTPGALVLQQQPNDQCRPHSKQVPEQVLGWIWLHSDVTHDMSLHVGDALRASVHVFGFRLHWRHPASQPSMYNPFHARPVGTVHGTNPSLATGQNPSGFARGNDGLCRYMTTWLAVPMKRSASSMPIPIAKCRTSRRVGQHSVLGGDHDASG